MPQNIFIKEKKEQKGKERKLQS